MMSPHTKTSRPTSPNNMQALKQAVHHQHGNQNDQTQTLTHAHKTSPKTKISSERALTKHNFFYRWTRHTNYNRDQNQFSKVLLWITKQVKQGSYTCLPWWEHVMCLCGNIHLPVTAAAVVVAVVVVVYYYMIPCHELG